MKRILSNYKLEGKESPAHHFHNWIRDLPSKLFLSIIQNFLLIFKCACLAFSHLQAFTYTIPLLFIWHIPRSYSSGQTFMTPLDWFRSTCSPSSHGTYQSIEITCFLSPHQKASSTESKTTSCSQYSTNILHHLILLSKSMCLVVSLLKTDRNND